MTTDRAMDILAMSAQARWKDGIEPEDVNKAVETIKKALQSKPSADVLDKIRAEIEQAADKQFQIAMGVSDLNERYAHIQMENAYRHSLNVIDKYKAESGVSG